MWHLPGGFLLKGETLAECQQRLAGEFDSEINPKEGEFLGLVENISQDPRGHLLHYVVRYKNQKVSAMEGKTRYFKTLPSETIPFQRQFLQKLGYS